MPHWERRYPGRLQWELNDLQQAGITPEIDSAALARGVLILRFEWPLNGRKIPLEAVYPDSFPRLRPQVRLLGDRAQFPARHCSPVDGNLCLLGRDTRQWVPQLTLRKLLDEKLADALSGTGDEDFQGEPAEFWWNGLATNGSYCLIDSGWTLGAAMGGTLRLQYQLRGSDSSPVVRAVVTEVRDEQKAMLAKWSSAIPPELVSGRLVTIPWMRVDSPLLPTGNPQQVADLWNANAQLRKHPPQQFGPNLHALWFAIAYPTEVSWKTTGLGWLFPFIHGQKQAFDKTSKKKTTTSLIRTFRAGAGDLGARVPAVACLREKRVAVFGLGAIGAPLAIDLARNGCRLLRLAEHDIVEPGNSVRWPLGASAWATGKLPALGRFLAQEYPWTEVVLHAHNIGTFSGADGTHGDDAVLSTVLNDVDLVVDATASYGVTNLLGDHCKARGLPLIVLFATPSVEGGVVARFEPDDGCSSCLEHAWHSETIRKPPGLGNETGLQQPPGCAERTFTGAGYDLQELSLQAVRLVVDTLCRTGAPRRSLVQTLSLVDAKGSRILPHWDVDSVPIHPNCSCHRRH